MNKEIRAFPMFNSHEMFPDMSGMTLRDYFAAKALPTLIMVWEKHIAKENHNGINVILDKNLVAEECYEYADAMLKAREVKS